jgi:hypothetical protein
VHDFAHDNQLKTKADLPQDPLGRHISGHTPIAGSS